MSQRPLLLIGNPNVGKSLLFGCLTNRYVTVSNYPGTTVEITRARAVFGEETREVIDTPGTNGLIPQSDDERVARDMLLACGDGDIVQVGDMSNLRRTLLLSLQIAEYELPFTLCLNMCDEARERGAEVDPVALSETLGVPVVATSALRRWNIEKLKREALQTRKSTLRAIYPPAIEEAIAAICGFPVGGQAPSPVGSRDRRGPSPATGNTISRGHALSIIAADDTHAVAIANARVAAVDALIGAAASRPTTANHTFRDFIGRISIHPIWGIPFLAVVLWIAYLFVGKFGAGYLVDVVEGGLFETYINPFAIRAVDVLRFPHFLRDLLVGPYGLITMALTYAIAIVLPVVTTFFLFFGVLEDSGYLPRLAVMLNRLFRKMGLNGKAVLPMVLGLGCDTMATLTTRILETKKEATIVTLLLALGVPCSAQLGVILAMLGPLGPQAISIWLAVTIGTIFLVGWAASKVVPGNAGDFILEIPPVRVPKLSNIAIKVLARTEWYLKEAVPLFVVGTLLLWGLDALHLLQAIQRWLSPLVVTGLGLPAQASNAFVIGFLRRDYGAAGLFAMQRAGNLTPSQTVVALTVITLFIPCVANFLVMLKERGRRGGLVMAAFIIIYSFGIGVVLNAALKIFGVEL